MPTTFPLIDFPQTPPPAGPPVSITGQACRTRTDQAAIQEKQGGVFWGKSPVTRQITRIHPSRSTRLQEELNVTASPPEPAETLG